MRKENEFKRAARMWGLRVRWNDGGDPPAGDPPAGDPPAGDPPTFAEQIPEEFRDKPWAKENAESPEKFFKFVDNQNAMVGKKGIVPLSEGDPVERVNEYLKSIGRPDSADGYEFTQIDALKGKERDAEVDSKVKQILFDAGTPKDIAAKIVQGYEQFTYDKHQEIIAQQDEIDAAYEKYTSDFFGDRKEAVVANAQKILRDVLPKEALPVLDKMSAEQVALVVAATDGVYAKYGKEDGFRGGAPGGAPQAGESYDELSAKQRELMGKDGFTDWRHPDHESLKARNAVLVEKMRAIKK